MRRTVPYGAAADEEVHFLRIYFDPPLVCDRMRGCGVIQPIQRPRPAGYVRRQLFCRPGIRFMHGYLRKDRANRLLGRRTVSDELRHLDFNVAVLRGALR
jgi:hypothetical protein